MEFSRQEHWSGVAISCCRGSSRPRDQSLLSASLALAGGFFTTPATWEAHKYIHIYTYVHTHTTHTHTCTYTHIIHTHTHAHLHSHTHQTPLSMENSPDKNSGVGEHSLLQGIILTQGLNPGLISCIAGRFVTLWVTKEALSPNIYIYIIFWLWASYSLFFYEFQKSSGRGFVIRKKVVALCKFGGMVLSILLTFFIHYYP